MKNHFFEILCAALVTGAACFLAVPVHAGSCCGGGGATTLVLPKFSQGMVDLSFDFEKYNGLWNDQGKYIADSNDLRQYRLNFGYAQRLARNWQASITVPYIWNENKYSGLSSHTEGIGDTTLSLWYETFDRPKSMLNILDWRDLIPAVTLGTSLTIPTGISPYDNVGSSFDVTGRGFYRLDGNVLLDKTVYPWTASLLLSYGTYLERPVNSEYGNYVEPYRKKLGDRTLGTVALGYISFLESRNILTYMASFSYLNEAEGTRNGDPEPTTGFRKDSIAGTISYAAAKTDMTYKFSWSHAIREDGWGKNFPTTDIYTLGVSHAFR